MAKIVNEVAELIQAADAAQATVAAVKAYIANDPNAKHKHQEEGNAYEAFKAMSDKEFLSNVVQDQRGNVVFKGVDPDLYNEALLRWCQLNKIPCTDTLASQLVLIGNFKYKLPASMISNPHTMKMLCDLAGHDGLDSGFGGNRNFFFWLSENLKGDQINQICSTCKGSAAAGRKLCDAVFGPLTDGKDITSGETTIRMMCGQIQKGWMNCTAFGGVAHVANGQVFVGQR